jgi:hypothetical protein
MEDSARSPIELTRESCRDRLKDDCMTGSLRELMIRKDNRSTTHFEERPDMRSVSEWVRGCRNGRESFPRGSHRGSRATAAQRKSKLNDRLSGSETESENGGQTGDCAEEERGNRSRIHSAVLDNKVSPARIHRELQRHSRRKGSRVAWARPNCRAVDHKCDRGTDSDCKPMILEPPLTSPGAPQQHSL